MEIFNDNLASLFKIHFSEDFHSRAEEYRDRVRKEVEDKRKFAVDKLMEISCGIITNFIIGDDLDGKSSIKVEDGIARFSIGFSIRRSGFSDYGNDFVSELIKLDWVEGASFDDLMKTISIKVKINMNQHKKKGC